MQPPTVREIIRRLESEGFKNVRTVGDHRRYVKGNRKVTVAGKPNEHLHPKNVEKHPGASRVVIG